ncbi:MAG: hypothetical protein AAF657_34405 [Acidobacteriota bacterium]
MQAKSLLKGFFTFAMATALVAGLVHISAQPAEASSQCPETFRGNPFSHVQQTGYICCCVYEKPSGDLVQGPSWYC